MGGADSRLTERLTRLEWDSAHFGFPVGRIDPTELTAPELRQVLGDAQRADLRLVYWAAPPVQNVSALVLEEFSGRLVDCKVTYRANLLHATAAAPPRATPGQVLVGEYPQAESSERLMSLALAAGEYSRYRRDPKFPEQKFRGLYETWMRRSTLREIADVVLVASWQSAECVGMATIRNRDGAAQIGLFAVHDAYRGRGVGSRLLGAATTWMRDSGAMTAEVVTQQDNLGACRLYERHGFAPVALTHYYHFWPTFSPAH